MGDPLRFVTFETETSKPRVGALTGNGVLDLPAAAERLGEHLPDTLQALIELGSEAWARAQRLVEACPTECLRPDARLLAPIPRPVRLRDASLFLEHMEAALARQGRPMSPEFYRQIIYYNADHLHIFGPEADVPWPAASNSIDYELEWACVIGLPGVDISTAGAAAHIFGYTIFNDWSARDLQFAFMEAGLGPGAGKDFANSLGPCIVTSDELPDPYALRMAARVNGITWSSGVTGSMHHTFEDAIRALSADRPLAAGEIIGSGTVLGGCGYELGRELIRGDRVELEIEGIGVLANRVI